MTNVTLSDFRNNQSDYIAAAQREPVQIMSRGTNRRAVLVSPEFFDRAIEALEDKIDSADAAAARRDGERIPFDSLLTELGL